MKTCGKLGDVVRNVHGLGGLLTVAMLTLSGAVGCGSSTPATDPRFPPRAEGCEVQVYPEAPNVPTDSIGVVSATCGETISNADCLRTLKDEACKLGADVLWGVADEPVQSITKKKLSGRAAHTKTGK